MAVNKRGVKYDEKDMKIARLQAAKSVLMQALAYMARDPNYTEIAKDYLRKADEAYCDVHPDDLYDPNKINLN